MNLSVQKLDIPSPFFFSNKKTVVSVDFGICQLMNKTTSGGYTSKICSGCYSAIALSLRPPLKNKLESLPSATDDNEFIKFQSSLKIIKNKLKIKKLRFYSFGDFSPAHVRYIVEASKFFEVDIISKALSFPTNEQHLLQLMKHENVWISLSFNKNFMTFFERIKNIILKSECSRVGMNYTVNVNEENPDTLPFRDDIQVWHLKNDLKRDVLPRFKTLRETNVCGVFDARGSRTKTQKKHFESGVVKRMEEQGSCVSCNNCRNGLLGGEEKLPSRLRVKKCST